MGAQADTLERVWVPPTLERVLAEHPLLRGCHPQYIQLLAGCASNVRFNAGEVIFRQGDQADLFYLIRQGKVALEVPDSAGDPIIIQTLTEGDVLGWSWAITPYRWHFDARAVELTRAIALDGKCLREKCEVDHDLGYEVMRRVTHVMEHRLQATRLQLLDVYGRSRADSR
jgi:CRP/FNR family cyclic AMP-dependent transcriptional regulator